MEPATGESVANGKRCTCWLVRLATVPSRDGGFVFWALGRRRIRNGANTAVEASLLRQCSFYSGGYSYATVSQKRLLRHFETL